MILIDVLLGLFLESFQRGTRRFMFRLDFLFAAGTLSDEAIVQLVIFTILRFIMVQSGQLPVTAILIFVLREDRQVLVADFKETKRAGITLFHEFGKSLTILGKLLLGSPFIRVGAFDLIIDFLADQHAVAIEIILLAQVFKIGHT